MMQKHVAEEKYIDKNTHLTTFTNYTWKLLTVAEYPTISRLQSVRSAIAPRASLFSLYMEIRMTMLMFARHTGQQSSVATLFAQLS